MRASLSCHCGQEKNQGKGVDPGRSFLRSAGAFAATLLAPGVTLYAFGAATRRRARRASPSPPMCAGA